MPSKLSLTFEVKQNLYVGRMAHKTLAFDGKNLFFGKSYSFYETPKRT